MKAERVGEILETVKAIRAEIEADVKAAVDAGKGHNQVAGALSMVGAWLLYAEGNLTSLHKAIAASKREV